MIRYSAATLLVATACAVPIAAISATSTPLAARLPAQHIAGAVQRAVSARPTLIRASSANTPMSVPNLTLWLDGADSNALIQSGGKLSEWLDKSGKGYNVSQSSASLQPTVVPGALNGLSNVAFDGSTSYLLSTNAFTQSIYPASTTFIVANGVDSGSNESTLWNGNNVAGYPRWSYSIPSAHQVKFFFGGQADQLVYPSVNLGSSAIYDGGESVTTQQGFINYNGSNVGSISGNITGDSGSNPLSLGVRYQPNPVQISGHYKGNVAEVLVYSALLTTAQVQQVEGYLACKWGLQSSLPANHPYRNSCSGGGPPPPTAVDVDTYHNDALRTGWNKNETTLTPANVGTSAFGMVGNLPVDGLSFTQPLVAANVSGAFNHNLVITGTNNDSLYAFDATTGSATPLWKRSFTGSGVTTVGIAYTGCDNTGQQDGLLSTPVIDRSTDTIYVVAATMEPHHIHFRLHALSLATGADKMPNVEIVGSYAAPGEASESFDPDAHFQRPALLEANGNIYVGFGSQCDYHKTLYHGWVFGYSASNFAQIGRVNLTPDTTTGDGSEPFNAGGIWMSGEGLSADASGNIYFSTGNGTFDGGAKNFGESVMRLPPSLSMGGMSSASFFTPSTYYQDNGGDQDLGSGGVMLLPDQPFSPSHLAVAQGKDGYLTLLNRDNLGGYHSGYDNALAEHSLGGVWSAPAYWQAANGTGYVLTTGGPLYLVQVGSNSLTVRGQTSVSFPSDNGNGSTPSVSSNGTVDSSAVVWIVKRVANANGQSNYLYAFPATNLGTQLYSASLGGWPQNDLNPTLVPTIANGRVYVPTQNSIAVFGLH